ncbi:MAG TPA: hypothetical protein VFD43_09065 [Planctomycetota bacterium]|nr:hypothetical protein [Planctomycetota bacterium]
MEFLERVKGMLAGGRETELARREITARIEASQRAARQRHPDYDAVLQGSGLLRELELDAMRMGPLWGQLYYASDPAEAAYQLARSRIAVAAKYHQLDAVRYLTAGAGAGAAPAVREALVVDRDGRRTLVRDTGQSVHRRALVDPAMLQRAHAGDVTLPNDEAIRFQAREYRDSGARDAEGRRIFVEEGPPDRHLVAGPTLGYRAWALKDGLLQSTGSGAQRWEPGEPLVAVCRARPSDPTVWQSPSGLVLANSARASAHPGIPAPWRACTCGLYAIRRLEDLPKVTPAGGIVGQLALWGHVIEHHLGYRAQYAYPVRLWAPATDAAGPAAPRPPGFPRGLSVGEALAARYGVPWGPPA